MALGASILSARRARCANSVGNSGFWPCHREIQVARVQHAAAALFNKPSGRRIRTWKPRVRSLQASLWGTGLFWARGQENSFSIDW